MSNGRKLSLSPTNPLALLNLTDDTSEVERIIANAKIDYDIPFANNLTATLSIGVDESEGIGVSYTDPLIPTDELGFNGSGSNYSNTTTNEILTNFPDAYLYGSLIHAAPYLQEDKRTTTWAALYQASIDGINSESNQAKFGGNGRRMRVRAY